MPRMIGLGYWVKPELPATGSLQVARANASRIALVVSTSGSTAVRISERQDMLNALHVPTNQVFVVTPAPTSDLWARQDGDGELSLAEIVEEQ